MRRDRSNVGRWGVVFCAAVVLSAGCGDGDGEATSTTHDMGSMDMGSMDTGSMYMGDASATRAEEAGGALVQGTFELLDTRPPGLDAVSGTAAMARTDAGTTVTVEFDGLDPGESYIAHVHTGVCADGSGHYRFDRGGPAMPPNEIHLAFDADAEGHGFMTAENDGTVGDDGRSVVVHPAALMDNWIACADLG